MKPQTHRGPWILWHSPSEASLYDSNKNHYRCSFRGVNDRARRSHSPGYSQAALPLLLHSALKALRPLRSFPPTTLRSSKSRVLDVHVVRAFLFGQKHVPVAPCTGSLRPLRCYDMRHAPFWLGSRRVPLTRSAITEDLLRFNQNLKGNIS